MHEQRALTAKLIPELADRLEEWQAFESAFSSLHQGFSGTFDRLAEYLAKI